MIIYDLYKRGRKNPRAQEGTIRSHFAMSTLSEHDKALFVYIQLLVCQNLTFSIVEDDIFANITAINSRSRRKLSSKRY